MYFSIMVVNFIMCDATNCFVLITMSRTHIPGLYPAFCHLHLQRDYITKLPADWSISTLLWNDTIPSIYFTYTCSHINTVTVETG